MIHDPLLADRVVVRIGREPRPGRSPQQMRLFPAFGNQGELAQVSATEISAEKASSDFGRRVSKLVNPVVQFPALRTFLYGEADAALSVWTWLLEACGMHFRPELSSPTQQVWYAEPSNLPPTVALQLVRDRWKMEAAACRGAFSLGAAVGEPIALTFAMAGRYLPEGLVPMPVATFPTATPIALCGIGLTVTPEGLAPFTPRGVQSLEFGLEAETVLRPVADRDGERATWKIANLSPVVRITTEQSRSWDWMAERQRAYRLTCSLQGEALAWEWDFVRCGLSDPPQGVRLPTGIQGQNLVFRAVGRRGAPVVLTRRVL